MVQTGDPLSKDRDPRNETFLKLMLARRLRGASPLDVVALERREAFARLHEITLARSEAERQKRDLPALIMIDLAALRLEAFLKWLDHCEEMLAREGKK